MAAAAIRGLTNRLKTSVGCEVRTSLARMAALLIDEPVPDANEPIAPEEPNDLSQDIEETTWGPVRRIKPPVVVEGAPMQWSLPASQLGSAEPKWQGWP